MFKRPSNHDDDIQNLRNQVKNDFHQLEKWKTYKQLSYADLAFNFAHSLFKLIVEQYPNLDDKEKLNYLFYLSMIVGQIANEYSNQAHAAQTIAFQDQIQNQIYPKSSGLVYYAPEACSNNHQLSPQYKESHHRLNAVRKTIETMGLVTEANAPNTVQVFSWPHYAEQCRNNMMDFLTDPNKKASDIFKEQPNLTNKDLPVTENTALAIGAALNAAENAAQRTLKNIENNRSQKIFCAIRPPSHHAHPDHPEGFCYANAVIQTAVTLMNAGKKVLMIDIDAHHGNGTYEHLKQLPAQCQSLYKMVDVFSAKSYMDNNYMQSRMAEAQTDLYRNKIHLHPMQENEYTGSNVLTKITTSVNHFKNDNFIPDVIIVSAGFDAGEQEGFNGHLTHYDFGKIGEFIASQSSHVISLLEGGYRHQDQSLQHSVFSYIAGTANQLPPIDAPYPLRNISAAHESLNYLYRKVVGETSPQLSGSSSEGIKKYKDKTYK